MSGRGNAARMVRQRKLNPKQNLRIIRESEIDELPEDESQRQVHQLETGVDKAEETVCCHLLFASALSHMADGSSRNTICRPS